MDAPGFSIWKSANHTDFIQWTYFYGKNDEHLKFMDSINRLRYSTILGGGGIQKGKAAKFTNQGLDASILSLLN